MAKRRWLTTASGCLHHENTVDDIAHRIYCGLARSTVAVRLSPDIGISLEEVSVVRNSVYECFAGCVSSLEIDL